MEYSVEISRDHPALFLFLLDQSKNMEQSIGGNDPDSRQFDRRQRRFEEGFDLQPGARCMSFNADCPGW